MLFAEADEPLLKAWIVKRLGNPADGDNDVDADVLADYVLALLKHDGDEKEIRKLCETELPDFLKDGSSAFVADVFEALHYKLYQPGAAPPPPRTSLPAQGIAIAPSAAAASTSNGIQAAPPPPKGSRKRGYHESASAEATQNMPGRVFKQPRRGAHGGRGSRMEDMSGLRGGGGGGGVGGSTIPSGFQTRSLHGRQAFVPPVAQNRTQFDGNFSLDAFMQQLQQQAAQFALPMPEFPPMRQQKRPSRRRKNQMCRDFQNKGFCARSNCAFEHGLPAEEPRPDEYDPRQALMALTDDGNQQPLPPQLQGFLANGSAAALGFPPGMMAPVVPQQNQKQRKGRAPFSADGPVNDRTKSTIVIENIPEEQFDEDHVRSFFSQFGNIVEVSMQPYKRLAIVKFDNWGAANAAYRSPKVIFDNRFVKVFWYKDDATALPQSVSVQLGGGGGGGGSGKQPASGSQPSATGSPMEGEPEMDMEEFARKQEEAQKQHEERKQKQQEIDRQREELDRRHKELLAKQQEERQKLHARIKAAATQSLSSGDADPSSSPDITLGAVDGGSSSAAAAKASSQTEALRAQLAALEEEAKSLGLDPNAADDASSSWSSGSFRGRGRGGGYFRSRGFAPRGLRGGHRGGGRGGGGSAAFAAYSLDNRPKKVAVTGVDFTAPEKDEILRQYLLGIGDFTNIETTPAVTQITFTDRRTAEKFYYGVGGKEIPGIDGRVELGWVAGSAATPSSLTDSALGASATDDAAAAAATAKHDVNGDTLMGGSGVGAGSEANGVEESDSHFDEEAAGREHAQMDFDVADENDWEIR